METPISVFLIFAVSFVVSAPPEKYDGFLNHLLEIKLLADKVKIGGNYQDITKPLGELLLHVQYMPESPGGEDFSSITNRIYRLILETQELIAESGDRLDGKFISKSIIDMYCDLFHSK
ncbi:hypothetical protein HHI36_021254 [Cryptolaemus montrouzieri]|uniref:Uncharacterized protein n=1 Tax=Cryptolaemus montrouzieri TaxID=559131 RepID=A0ABD2MW92_9CUCU